MGRRNTKLICAAFAVAACAGCATARDVAIPLLVAGAAAAALAPAAALIVTHETDYPQGDAVLLSEIPAAALLAAGLAILQLTESATTGAPVAKDYLP